MFCLSRLLWVILGMVLAVALICLAVAIGSTINGVTFNQQIIDWLTVAPPLDEEGKDTVDNEVVEETVETVVSVLIE